VELGTLRSAASVSLRFSAARSNSDVSRAGNVAEVRNPLRGALVLDPRIDREGETEE
jgi:hypothetical protein